MSWIVYTLYKYECLSVCFVWKCKLCLPVIVRWTCVSSFYRHLHSLRWMDVRTVIIICTWKTTQMLYTTAQVPTLMGEYSWITWGVSSDWFHNMHSQTSSAFTCIVRFYQLHCCNVFFEMINNIFLSWAAKQIIVLIFLEFINENGHVLYKRIWQRTCFCNC